MSRTPLFRLLRRSLQLARVANTTGRSAGEVVDLARDGAVARAARARFTRRDLLATTAITGAWSTRASSVIGM